LKSGKDRSDEWGKQTEDEDRESFDDSFNKSFEAGDFLDDGGDASDYFVTEGKDGVDLFDGFGGVKIGHAYQALGFGNGSGGALRLWHGWWPRRGTVVEGLGRRLLPR